MESGTVSIGKLSYQELLKNHAEPYVQVIARKYTSRCVELHFEDLCQEGRMKLWQHHNYYAHQKPDMSVKEFIRIFKRTMTNLCKDMQRKYLFAEKRSVNKTIDLDWMLAAIEGREPSHLGSTSSGRDFLEEISYRPFRLTMIELETRELLENLRARLQPLEGRILEEMVNPSEQLITICQKDQRKRVTYKIHLCYLADLLNKSYDEIRQAFSNVADLIREVCPSTQTLRLRFNS